MGSTFQNSQLRVLVVDDNEDAALLTSALLEVCGMQAQAVYDGASALALAPALDPDVIILDLGMPGLSGFDVAVAMRRLPGFAHKRLVALSGWGDPDTRKRSAAAGFDLHLQKPAGLDQLLSALSPTGS